MAYQPLFGSIHDRIGTRTSHSRRGVITEIRYNLNSHFGDVISVASSSDGKGDIDRIGNRLRECEEKAQKWKDNPRKLGYWEECLKQTRAKWTEEDKKIGVHTSISIENNPKMLFAITTNKIGINIKDGNIVFNNTATDALKQIKEDIEQEIAKRCAEQL